MGLAYYDMNNYEEALECYEESIKISLKLLGEEHILIVNTYNNIGLVYEKLTNYAKALEY